MPAKGLESHYRTCNLCEAMCGLKIEFSGNKVHSIKGDKHDPFSQGHICPKAVALQDIYSDKDRLRSPIQKTKNGWTPISWKEAFSIVAQRIGEIQQQFGNDSVGVYQGNPNVHNLEAMLYAPSFFRQLKTKNRYSATSVDQLPHHLASMLMFGHPMMLSVPDIDRTDYLVILGANPIVSNGSIMSSPNIKKRLKAIQQRGGKFITIDPRYTETAQLADQHLAVKPGTDALLLMAMLHFLFEHELVHCNGLDNHIEGLELVKSLVVDYTPDAVANLTGITADQIAKIVTDFCQAESAALYARIGVSTHEFGSVVNWLVNVFNLLTGNLDSPGGAMFAKAAVDIVGTKIARVKKFARYRSRVSGYPETISELPVVALAEEILTPGKGQIKAMFVAAGNPLLSTPNNQLLTQAFEQLDFMVSIDFYLNETSKHADIILPPPSPLERPHYDLIFNQLAVRNYARYSEPLFQPEEGSLTEAEIYSGLILAFAQPDIKSRLTTWSKLTMMKWLGTKGMLDKAIKKGPYGKNQANNLDNELNQENPELLAGGLTIKKLISCSHGLDLGPLKPRFPEGILTENRKIQLAPDEFVADLNRLNVSFINARLARAEKPQQSNQLLLIGRRDARTCNSWMHNSYRLVKGKPGCIAHINSKDAERMEIGSGELIRVTSRVGEITIPVEVTDSIRQGVISIPHGWGHGVSQTKLAVANAHTGVSVNNLTDEKFVDQLTGNAALNGVPVLVTAA